MIRTVTPASVRGTIVPPPSKSYTHRALVASHLSGRVAHIVRPLYSDDTRATAMGLAALGSRVAFSEGRWTVRPVPTVGARRRTIDCHESGTTLRLLSALAALHERPIRLVGRGRLPVRPMEELYGALRTLGADVRPERRGRSLPCTIRGPIGPGRIDLRADETSQHLSALLMALPRVDGVSEIRLLGRPVSETYVEATRAVLRAYGIRTVKRSSTYRTDGPQTFRPISFLVPGDASSAAYFWAAGAIAGGPISVEGIDRRWPQADLFALEVLRRMGATVRSGPHRIEVCGRLRRGAVIDLTAAPDLYPLVGVLAATIPGGTTRIQGAAHVRLKESDRHAATARLARSLGARVRDVGGDLVIRGVAVPHAFAIEDLDDHRLVMSAAVAALAADAPSRIGDARAVGKSFPEFWTALDRVLVAPGGAS